MWCANGNESDEFVMLMYCNKFFLKNIEFNDDAGKNDIDLRMAILPARNVKTDDVVPTSTTSEPKKRLSTEQFPDEPKAKKSKSDKIDMYVFSLLSAIIFTVFIFRENKN